MTLVDKTENCRMAFPCTCIHHDRSHEFLSDDPCIHISLQTGAGANMRFADPIFSNYKRILADKVFQQSIVNTSFI